MLQKFGVRITAIDWQPISDWELPQVPEFLNALHLGDCRQTELLEKAQVKRCRAVLLVTNSERVNLETAFAARLLNPDVRLVVRSAKQNLNQLLDEQLGNLIAFEPTQLSAPAFALAALGNAAGLAPENSTRFGRSGGRVEQEILGMFHLEQDIVQVVRQTVTSDHPWCHRWPLHELMNRNRRVLVHEHEGIFPCLEEETLFHCWDPDNALQPGDHIITVEIAAAVASTQVKSPSRNPLIRLWPGGQLNQVSMWKDCIRHWWHTSLQNQIRRVGLICTATILTLWGLGTLLLSLHYPEVYPWDAFNTVAVLLLGGYGDVFAAFEQTQQAPQWLQFFALLLTLAGTAFIGVLYALLTEKLLTWRLALARRPAIPPRDHIIVIGLGRVGQRVASLLQSFRQPVVGIASSPLEATVLPHLALLVGHGTDVLDKANLQTAKSLVAVTDDEMDNLETALTAHAANPSCRLAIRTYDQRFTERVAGLFPYANVLCASALSAEAFVAAAFGEAVLSLFRINHQTVLVTDYTLDETDTLHGLLLSEIAYGYGLVTILHHRVGQEPPVLMPSDDIRARPGDRLIVLATIAGLRRVERGEQLPRRWYVHLEKVWTQDAAFAGATELARVTGCSLRQARETMQQLPIVFPMPLYYQQARRLVRRLKRSQITASSYGGQNPGAP